jgi:hypothetical protein
MRRTRHQNDDIRKVPVADSSPSKCSGRHQTKHASRKNLIYVVVAAKYW